MDTEEMVWEWDMSIISQTSPNSQYTPWSWPMRWQYIYIDLVEKFDVNYSLYKLDLKTAWYFIHNYTTAELK
jgi:hypothetical protein